MREALDEIVGRAGVGLAQVETTGCYVFVNARYCQMIGRSREELLDLRMQEVTHPDDLPVSLDGFIRAIETGTPRIINQRYIRSDGSSLSTSNLISPAYDREGNPEFVLVLTHESLSGGAPEQSLGEAQSDLRALIDSAADGFYSIDRDGRSTFCNAAFLRMLGFEREEDVLGRDLCEVIRRARPDGAPFSRAECPIYKVTQSGRPAHVPDETLLRLDGTSFPVEYWARPILREGQIHGAVCTFVDLSERKRFEAQQELLNRELAHRVKNTLAMVQAIVGQTLRLSATPREAMHSIEARLVSLSEAHTVLTRTRWGNASIVDVVESAVALHRSEAHRIEISGPRIDLGSRAALTLTLALHELCTNAAKYGALSNDVGTVAIAWSVTGGAARARFHLTWQERGGPRVAKPARRGFGSRMIAEQFGADFDGEARLKFEPAGVVWTLDTSLAAIRG